MTTATVTPATIAATVADTLPSPDALAAAVAAVSVSSDGNAVAVSTLAEIVLARYTFHARSRGTRHNGVAVLRKGDHKEVAARLWLDATGNVTPVPTADRRAGERSLAQYVSRFGRVAQSLDYGTSELTDLDTAMSAVAAIAASEAAAKANEAAALEALNAMDDAKVFHAWLSSQSAALQTAFKNVAHALKTDGAPHVPAFVASITE